MALFHSLAVILVVPMTSALLAPSPLLLIASLTSLKSSGATAAEEPLVEEAPFAAAFGRVDAVRFLVPLTWGAFFLIDLSFTGAGASSRLFSASLTAAEVLSLVSFSTSACSTFRGRHFAVRVLVPEDVLEVMSDGEAAVLCALEDHPFGP